MPTWRLLRALGENPLDASAVRSSQIMPAARTPGASSRILTRKVDERGDLDKLVLEQLEKQLKAAIEDCQNQLAAGDAGRVERARRYS